MGINQQKARKNTIEGNLPSRVKMIFRFRLDTEPEET
jgi:hypothetical protein